MGETHRHEAQIYQLRTVLRGISPLIWRRLLVRSDSTVAQLHQALQVAFGWDDEHLNRFEIRGREYAVFRDGGGMIGIDARGVRLDGLKLRRLERFLYEYDFGDSWIHDLRLEATLPINPRKIYPMCVAGKCSAPPEDCGGPSAIIQCAFGLLMVTLNYEAHAGSDVPARIRPPKRTTAH
jgi:Plasmid pRiA4b ORF-3-like protein